MGKWKCLWCSKVLEGESFMDLIAASAKEEGGQSLVLIAIISTLVIAGLSISNHGYFESSIE